MKRLSFSSDSTQLLRNNGLEDEMLEYKHYTVDIWYFVRCARTFFFFRKTIDHGNDFCANKCRTILKRKSTWPLKCSTNATILLIIHTVKII